MELLKSKVNHSISLETLLMMLSRRWQEPVKSAAMVQWFICVNDFDNTAIVGIADSFWARIVRDFGPLI